MIYKLKKYYSTEVDRRKLLDEAYALRHGASLQGDEYTTQDFWPALSASLKKENHYIDAGFGVGGWLLFLHDEGYSIEGFDEAAKVLRAVTEYNPDIAVKQGSLTAISYANASADGVISIGSLDHVEHELPKAISELSRVIKKDGYLYLEVPFLNLVRRLLYVPLKQAQSLIMRGLSRQEVFAGYLFDRAGLTALLEGEGFELVHVQPHDLPNGKSHYGLYTDWKYLRGPKPYELNIVGRLLKVVCLLISPWLIATGMFVIAKKIKD